MGPEVLPCEKGSLFFSKGCCGQFSPQTGVRCPEVTPSTSPGTDPPTALEKSRPSLRAFKVTRSRGFRTG